MGKEKKKKAPLKWSMVAMLLLGWLLPLMLIAFCLLYFVSSMVSAQIEKTIHISADKAVEICNMQMGEIVTASKNASYISTVRESYSNYKNDGNRQNLYNEVTAFLNEQYKYNSSFLCTMLFFLEEPEDIFYTYNTYQDNNMGSSGYDRVQFFQNNVQEDMIAFSSELDTGMMLKEVGGHIYLVRNLVNNLFRPYGMIVMELEPYNIFNSLESIWGILNYEIFVDGQPILDTGVGNEFDINKLLYITDKSVYVHTENHAYVYNVSQEGKQTVSYLMELDAQTIIDDLFMIRYLSILVLIFVIPLIIMIVRFFYNKVTRPISKLVNAATEIALGNYGLEVEGESNSEEFAYLERAFNTMSRELKYQFEKIYLEELALKDANIMALQSQINPHFLNNTLEIINWEARMNGNDKVSSMIEALSTMLDATMNRKQRRFVTLEEELSYVNAYFFITGKRYGDRFQVKWDVDESLLHLEVPILIIQPIVENAVEHGIANNRSGNVELHIYRKEDIIYIEVVNDGRLDQKDKEKIEFLLGNDRKQDEERHVSLGIRNVDRRLKIIYGEDCGLSIRGEGERTISTIKLHIRKEEQD